MASVPSPPPPAWELCEATATGGLIHPALVRLLQGLASWGRRQLVGVFLFVMVMVSIAATPGQPQAAWPAGRTVTAAGGPRARPLPLTAVRAQVTPDAGAVPDTGHGSPSCGRRGRPHSPSPATGIKQFIRERERAHAPQVFQQNAGISATGLNAHPLVAIFSTKHVLFGFLA